jgi:hypothetical protein
VIVRSLVALVNPAAPREKLAQLRPLEAIPHDLGMRASPSHGLEGCDRRSQEGRSKRALSAMIRSAKSMKLWTASRSSTWLATMSGVIPVKRVISGLIGHGWLPPRIERAEYVTDPAFPTIG